MGFKHQAKTYKLTFDDPELAGLEVRARSLSIGELRRFTDASQDEESSAQTQELLSAFARALISWNLEDEDGAPSPTTLEFIEAYPDTDFIMAMVNAWMTAVAGVDDELGKGSDSGRPSLEESIPMETLSPSLAS